MNKDASKTIIGLFVVGAIFLLIVGIVIFSSGSFFRRTYKCVLFFDGSVRGLSVGAPVNFRGVRLGSVKEINLVYEPETNSAFIPVIIEIETDRIKNTPLRYEKENLKRLVDAGLRARLETLSFVTGQLAVSLDFFPDRPARLYGRMKEYPEIPTIPSPFGELQKNIADIPLKDISLNLQESIHNLNMVLKEGKELVLYDLHNTLKQIREAAKSVKQLADFLEQHPESIFKGKR